MFFFYFSIKTWVIGIQKNHDEISSESSTCVQKKPINPYKLRPFVGHRQTVSVAEEAGLCLASRPT